MDKEKFLQEAFDIKKKIVTYTTEENKIIDFADSIISQRTEVVRSLENKVKKLSEGILRNVEDPKNWQPTDYLPNFSNGWIDDVNKIQEQSLQPELLIVLVGNMITEECLPTYQTILNRISATQDITGKEDTAWGKWTRWWTAEEKRHGDLLHTHLRFMPSLNMHAIERDIQYLLGSGFDPGIEEDPYKLLIYTSFQEKATYISHLGTGRIAREQGNEKLYDICNIIAKDESRHFSFYKSVTKEIFNVDQNGGMTAYARMMKKIISMPAKELSNSRNPTLFSDFSELAQSTNIYTASDYAGIIKQLNEEWEIKDQEVTSPEAIKAKEYLLKLPDRYLKLVNRRKSKEFDISKFDWIKQEQPF
jgi:acyl-[acyl-carrier-protein] desaturase